MFYVHSLLSTWVFHCSIWISQENICGHICFGTNEREKYESLPGTRFIKNWRLTAHRVLFFPSCETHSVSLSGAESSGGPNQHVWATDLIWPHAGLISEGFLSARLQAPLSNNEHKATRDVFSFHLSSPKSQIGLNFICYECLVGQRQCVKSIIHIKTAIKQIINSAL